MSKFDKALLRLKGKPRDFTWDELVTLLSGLGYEEKKGSGSRRKFINKNSGHVISLHEPHPGKILKIYMIKEVIETLEKQNLI
jgi:predicted RNA binding protein YcfA (HicA-like mRNA interferase family)